MNKQEFQEYYKKNKTVVIGVPIIVFVLLLDLLVLKPGRVRRQEERNAANRGTTAQPAVTPTDSATAAGASFSAEKPPIKLPDPVRPPSYPQLSEKVDSRFELAKVYPYPHNQRNIFTHGDKKMEIIPQMVEETSEESFERPEISYHGFFSLGADKVAILKTTDQLLLTRVGAMLKSSPFRLASVFPDRVIISDTTETDREFEVALSENTSAGGNKK